MKKSLIYDAGGHKVVIDDTLSNRFKAYLRGYKFIGYIDLSKLNIKGGGGNEDREGR